MREIGDLITAWRGLPEGTETVLATVVGTSGSTYRRAGARMLLGREGWLAGSISGGCLEGDVVQTAWDRTATGAALVTYDATADDDIVWGFGLGCNGVVQVLLERLTPDGGPLRFLAECHDLRREGVLATVVSEGPDLGRHYEVPGEDADPQVVSAARELLGRGGRELRTLGGRTLLFESVLLPRTLTIFGAGHDAVPLVQTAKAVGWYVRIVDWRPAYAKPERFPMADAVQLCRPDMTSSLGLEKNSAVVVMSHSYLNDLEFLRQVLPGAPAYVGLLGPLRRTERMIAEFGREITAEEMGKLRAPVGLDLGADEPDEIALAIVAEIQAFFTGRTAMPLDGYSKPLHPPSAVALDVTASEPVSCELN